MSKRNARKRTSSQIIPGLDKNLKKERKFLKTRSGRN
jgi:hypothetical protein